MKPHELLKQIVNISNVRHRAFVLSANGNNYDARLLVSLTDIIQQQEKIIEALMLDQGEHYAALKLKFESTGSLLNETEAEDGTAKRG